jgi:hypothetical protein
MGRKIEDRRVSAARITCGALPHFGAAAGLILLTGLAFAQHREPERSPASSGQPPFSIETYGELRNLMLRGDFSANAALGEIMRRSPSTGVGSMSGGRGEITIADGKLIVSYGKPAARPSPQAETAALLATARVKEWQTVQVASAVAPTALEAFLAQVAKAHGLDPDKSFPFQLRGTFGPYVMHVNAAPTDGPHGMGLPMAITVESRGDDIAGSAAGLYVSPALVGIATHGGQRTHAHWVSPDGASTAHLDLWGIKAGTILLLPKPE